MKDLIKLFEKIWISAAFAEAGEQETAQQFMGPDRYEEENAVTCQTV